MRKMQYIMYNSAMQECVCDSPYIACMKRLTKQCLHECYHEHVCVCVCVLVHVCLCVLVHDVLVYFYPHQWLENKCNKCNGHGLKHNQRANMWAK